MAMDSLKTALSPEEIMHFALMIKEMKNQWKTVASDNKTITAPIGSTPALFIVSHPVRCELKMRFSVYL
jgi:hypothetical protein